MALESGIRSVKKAPLRGHAGFVKHAVRAAEAAKMATTPTMRTRNIYDIFLPRFNKFFIPEVATYLKEHPEKLPEGSRRYLLNALEGGSPKKSSNEIPDYVRHASRLVKKAISKTPLAVTGSKGEKIKVYRSKDTPRQLETSFHGSFTTPDFLAKVAKYIAQNRQGIRFLTSDQKQSLANSLAKH